MTILDTSRKSWNTTPPRLIHTSQHRVVATPETSIRLDAAQLVQSSVSDAVAAHLARHPSKPWIAHGASGRDSILKWLTRERRAQPGLQGEAVAVLPPPDRVSEPGERCYTPALLHVQGAAE